MLPQLVQQQGLHSWAFPEFLLFEGLLPVETNLNGLRACRQFDKPVEKSMMPQKKMLLI